MSNPILLVDDNVDLLETYEMSLKLLGHTVIAATSAKHESILA